MSDGWIRCSERMPPRDRQVIVCYEGGQVWMDCWGGLVGGVWDSYADGDEDRAVTHWQPLPDPPKDDA